MSQSKILELISKVTIWLGLVVILFSPLYVNSHLFFPFIVTKTVAFNISVEIMGLAFLLLAWKNSEYRLRFNLVVILMAVYVGLSFLSSLLGDNFYHSFWSNNERSEGLLLLLHLFLFLIIISSFLRKIKDWLIVFDIFILSSFVVSLVALGQYFQLSWLFASSGGQRLAGTIGNAGYLAGFLVFGIFFGLLLLFERKNIYLKVYYAVIIALQSFIVLFTDTRGGILALLIGAALFILYLLFFYFKHKYFKIAGVAIIVIFISLPILVFTNKDSALVMNNRVLNRIASISSNTITAQTRLMTWNSAWQGFKERPILGWGYENFYQPFDKYFNPKIYRHDGSVIWFDRAHNIIFDRLLTGGVVGLTFYLLLLLGPYYFLWQYFYKQKNENNSSDHLGKKYFMPVVLSLLMMAYFIQNLFIFESLVIYIPLFLTLGFIGLFGRQYEWKFLADNKIKFYLFIMGVVVFLPAMYFFNLKPLQANILVAKALSNESISVNDRVSLFKASLSKNTPGNQEYRRQLYTFLETLIVKKFSDQAVINDVANFTGSELDKQLIENPLSVANYLLAMRYNHSMYTNTNNITYLEKNLELYNKSKTLSPARQVFYFEIGYTDMSLGSYYFKANQKTKSEEYYNLAIDNFKYALQLNDTNFESYRQLISVLIYANRNEEVSALLDLIDQKGDKLQYDKITFLSNVINTSIGVGNYEALKITVKKLINVDPSNVQYQTQLALAHAYLGENAQAIEIANKIITLNEEYRQQSEDFIKQVKAGEFKKK